MVKLKYIWLGGTKTICLKKLCLIGAILLLVQVHTIHAQQKNDVENKSHQTSVDEASALKRLLQLADAGVRTSERPYEELDLRALKELFPEAIDTTQQRYSAGKNQYKYRSVEKVNVHKLVPLLIVAIKQQEQRIVQLETALQAQ